MPAPHDEALVSMRHHRTIEPPYLSLYRMALKLLPRCLLRFLFHGAGSANLGTAALLRDEAGVPASSIFITNSRGVRHSPPAFLPSARLA